MTPKTIVVIVRLFAAAKEVARLSETKIELPSTSIADDVVTHLVRLYPSLSEFRPFIRIAVNEEYADPSRVLHDGDEVAILPPVSGGQHDQNR